MVAGDHPHVHPGTERGVDRVLGRGAQRVHDPDQRHHDEIGDRGHRVGQRRGHRRGVQVAGGEREYPQSAFGQLAVGGHDLLPHGGDRHDLAVPQRVSAVLEDHVRRALHAGEVWLLDDPAGHLAG